MPSIKHLVTGATGATGSVTAATLLQVGQDVRALVHREDGRSARLKSQGAEVVVGDLNDYGSVKSALQGVGRAYFCFPTAPGLVQASAAFAQASKKAGVEAIVNMSQVIAREDARSHASFEHWLSERVLEDSGIPTTHLRPTFFAEWLLYLSPMIRQGKVFAPYVDGKAALIAAEDQGRVIAGILQDPTPHAGHTYDLYGPTEQTFPEIIALVGRVLGRSIEYQQVPFEAMSAQFSSAGESAGRNDALTGYAESNRPDASGQTHLTQHLGAAVNDHHNGLFAGINDIVERITGRAPMTIEAFVLKHREAFA